VELVVAVNPSVVDFDDTAQAPNTPVAVVDDDNYRYFLVATAVVAGIPTTALIALYAFQIAYED
jgi:hypothetical protein